MNRSVHLTGHLHIARRLNGELHGIGCFLECWSTDDGKSRRTLLVAHGPLDVTRIGKILSLLEQVLIAEVSASEWAATRVDSHLHHARSQCHVLPVFRRRYKILLEESIDVLVGAIARERSLSLLHYLLHDQREVALSASISAFCILVGSIYSSGALVEILKGIILTAVKVAVCCHHALSHGTLGFAA